MRILRYLLKKEYLQIFRNKGMLPILFAMPVFQLLVLSFAATYELKQAEFAVVDFDRSILSHELVQKLQASDIFKLNAVYFSTEHALEEMEAGNIKMLLTIDAGFEKNIKSGKSAPIQITVDAVDGSIAGLIQSYSSSIIAEFNAEKLGKVKMSSAAVVLPKSVNIIPSNWYNPNLDYITFMVPGILVVLVSMIGIFLSGMNIVREYEMGTIEQLNVSPIKKWQFMVAKLVPFWTIGMFDLCIGLALARFGFNIPFLGSLVTILTIAGIYLIVIQVLGLLISTLTNTQQQAMFIAWFLMVIFILMGGLFTPIESMPLWAQNLTLANPVSYFIKIMRMVLLKGSGWQEVYKMVLVLVGMGALFLGIALNRFTKTSA
ncbi:MAG: ABC transporter permease [Balneolaceae bacterium]